ncbi:MAG: iron-siderophore ABC transporter substrate-binding protein [Nostoc sp.]|uniref:iron-siderophore ABC transporter substrate-binding protein n=1 Tax=Nostoc sp. TaxID=1180 RepID=UPI002FF05677
MLTSKQIVRGNSGFKKTPQRVVILDGFTWADAIVLGVKPIGAPLKTWMPLLQLAPEQSQGIVDVGFLPTNVEKVLALKPDLILGADWYDRDIYKLLLHIAPIVTIYTKEKPDWKDHLIQVAQALGKIESAQTFITEYNKRLQKFKATMGDKLSQTPILVVGPRNDRTYRVFTWEKGSFSNGILEDAGFTVLAPKCQSKKIETNGNFLVSWESLDLIDGNVIFLTHPNFGPEGEHQRVLKQHQATPLWSRLKSVQQRKVYQVGISWVGNGPIAANRALDDLFKYLLNSES